jgi:hypothetical protein
MRHGGSRLSWRPALVLFLGLCVQVVSAKPKTSIEVDAGPKGISQEESAIQPDAASGSEHGVILIEETDRNEDNGVETETSFHLRAKILSNEGRDLANVEIPYSRDTRLVKWWGRTLLPDGTVLELPESRIERQAIVKTVGAEVGAMKAVLPGVVPGCVIDYGYVVRQSTYDPFLEVDLERNWPIRRLRYRWQPYHVLSAAYRPRGVEGRKIEITRDGHSVLIVGNDLAAAKSEPMMPPQHEVRASVTFYYYPADAHLTDYWNVEAKRVERQVRTFNARKEPIEDALASMHLPPEADLPTKLKAVYDWIGTSLKNSGRLSAEEVEEADEDETKDVNTAKRVLEAKEGTPRQLDQLFIGMARRLGAEANLVLATDRTRRYWDTELRSMLQFGATLVAVRSPGEPDEKAVLVDVGSGLPYGEIPWWMTGIKGFLAAGEGARPISLPPSPPQRNVSETRADLRFSDDNASLLAKWTRTGKGQSGVDERISLRDMTPEDRKRRQEELCGASGEIELLSSELPGLNEPMSAFQISCETENTRTNLDEETGAYRLGVSGAWLENVPDLPTEARTQPVLFRFPRTDLLTLDIASPKGFTPSSEVAPIQLSTPYGMYLLSVSARENGYHVERSVTLVPLAVMASDYGSLQSFFAEIRRADRTLLAFKRVPERR